MPKCENCYHCEICKKYAIKSGVPETMLDKALGEEFEHLEGYDCYKDKSLIVELPCNIGDTVYTNFSVQGDYLRKKNRPYACEIVFIGLNSGSPFFNVEYGNGRMFQFHFAQIGKTVFLTREDAKKALNAEITT